MVVANEGRLSLTESADGTRLAYTSIGSGPSVIVFGGALSEPSDYMALARELSNEFEVHVVARRGRLGSGPMRPGHGLAEERDDLAAVAAATGARAVFGHSFGGLVALEAACQPGLLDSVVVYEPGVPLRGALHLDWLDRYEELLRAGERREAFAWMVKRNGFAPRLFTTLPLNTLTRLMRMGIRGERWSTFDRLLEVNLIEHRILAHVDAQDASRFAGVAAPTLLLGGSRSPAVLSDALLPELASSMPNATTVLLPRCGHDAPQRSPHAVAAAARAHLKQHQVRRTGHPGVPHG